MTAEEGNDDPGPSVETLYHHLAATRERPVERGASHWIAEAEAVVEDLCGDDVPTTVLTERLGHVETLLANVNDTEDADANRHVAAAKRLTAELLGELDEP